MGDKDVSLEEIKKLMQELGGDAQAYLTMGQLQHLVNEKNAAQARIQELEKNQIPEGYAVVDQKELYKLSNAKQELEAQAEKLKYSLGWLAAYAQLHDDPESSFNAEFIEGLIASSQELLSQAPVQSLQTVKREAEVNILNSLSDYFDNQRMNMAKKYGVNSDACREYSDSMHNVDAYIAANYEL